MTSTGLDHSHLQSQDLPSTQSAANKQFQKMKIFDKSNYMSYNLVLPQFSGSNNNQNDLKDVQDDSQLP